MSSRHARYTDVMAQNPQSMRQLTPPFPLSQFVDCFWIHSGYSPSHTRERVLPTGTIDLVFALGSDGRASSAVAGARSHFLELDTSRPFSAVGVHFKPGGGAPFFGVPGSELRNQSVMLDLLW